MREGGKKILKEKNRILIVDEDQEFVQTTLSTFVDQGYEVSLATSCEEGLLKLKEFSPDLIIIDLIMNKRGDGILFSRKLRRTASYKSFSKIPLLMLSDIKQKAEFTFPGLTRHPYFLPVDEFLEKPLTPEVLVQKAGDLLKATSA